MEETKDGAWGNSRVRLLIIFGAMLIAAGVILAVAISFEVIEETLGLMLGWNFYGFETENILSLLPILLLVTGGLSLVFGVKLRWTGKMRLEKKDENVQEDEPRMIEIPATKKLSPEEMRTKEAAKLKKLVWICGLTGLGEVLYVAVVIFLSWLEYWTRPDLMQYRGVGPILFGILGGVFIVTPVCGVVALLTIVQIKQAKKTGVEISWGQAIAAILGVLCCLMPMILVAIVMFIVPLF